MILIIGGAYQGKRAYAEQVLGAGPDTIVAHVERQILAWVQAGTPVQERLEAMMAEAWADKVLLLEDISSGIVPMEADARAWREAVGRGGAFLAARADRVIRVFCGLGTVLKDA